MSEFLHEMIEHYTVPKAMNRVTADRQFHAAIFQRKMELQEIEKEITKLEAKFRKAEKTGNVSGTFEIQDELGVMYNRLMKIWRIKSGRIQQPATSIQL